MDPSDEHLALSSIYVDEFTYSSADRIGRFDTQLILPFTPFPIRISHDSTDNQQQVDVSALGIQVLFSLPESYPIDPPRINVDAYWLSRTMQKRLEEKLTLLHQPGEVSLHSMFESLRADWLVMLTDRQDSKELVLNVAEFGPSKNTMNTLLRRLREESEESDQRQFDYENVTCPVCFESMKGRNCYRFKQCRHLICYICFHSHIEVCLSEGDVSRVRCPIPNCDNREVLDDNTVRSIFVKAGCERQHVQETVKKYRAAYHAYLSHQRSDATFCPRVGCGHFFFRRDIAAQSNVAAAISSSSTSTPGKDDGEESTLTVCPECDYAFCHRCLRTWHGKQAMCKVMDPLVSTLPDSLAVTSKIRNLTFAELKELVETYTDPQTPAKALHDLRMEYSQALLDQLVDHFKTTLSTVEFLQERVKSGEMRMCPGCRNWIEKNLGCHHMTCRVCHTHWCWICGS